MKIGIDIDGTITDAKGFFSILSDAFISAGHEVHIITYRDIETMDEIIGELKEYGVRYTRIHLPKPWDNHNSWKGDVARKIGLDVMFDDSPEVLDNMPKGVKRFWFCNPDVFNLKAAIVGMRSETRMGLL